MVYVDLVVSRPVLVRLSLLIFVGLLTDVQAAEDESVFLLHACAHNPTGIDPTQDQWAELSKLMKAKRHTAFFDCAYQVRPAYSTVQYSTVLTYIPPSYYCR